VPKDLVTSGNAECGVFAFVQACAAGRLSILSISPHEFVIDSTQPRAPVPGGLGVAAHTARRSLLRVLGSESSALPQLLDREAGEIGVPVVVELPATHYFRVPPTAVQPLIICRRPPWRLPVPTDEDGEAAATHQCARNELGVGV
jgi:hypothetical protein